MVLRLLILKHIRNWSYVVLEREVRANLVYREFTRVGGAKTPDAKTIGRWGVALSPEILPAHKAPAGYPGRGFRSAGQLRRARNCYFCAGK